MARRQGMGESKGDDRCIADGCMKKGKPRVFGTCGSRACVDKVNKSMVSAKDNRDPSRNAKVKVNGKWETVNNSGTKRGQHFVNLKNGHSVRLDDIEEWG